MNGGAYIPRELIIGIEKMFQNKLNMYQKSFLIRTSRIWNCLADELDLSPSTLASFKSGIFNYYKSALAVSLIVKTHVHSSPSV